MSIYSGFGIRKMQEKYNMFVGRLISLLQSDMIEFLSPKTKVTPLGSDFEKYLERKFSKYLDVLRKLQIMQQHKYLQPKFSHFCGPLKSFIVQIIPTQFFSLTQSSQRSLLVNRKSHKISRSVDAKQHDQSNVSHQSCQSKYQRMKTQSNTKQSQQMESKFMQFSQICENKEQSLDNSQIPIPIFTIEQEEQNAETKQLKMKKIHQTFLQTQSENSFRKKVYKSYNKTVGLQMGQNDLERSQKSSLHRRSKSEIKQHQHYHFKTRGMSAKHEQLWVPQVQKCKLEKRFYQTDINFMPKNEHYKYKRIKLLNKTKFKSSMNPKTERCIHVHNKKYLDRSGLKELLNT